MNSKKMGRLIAKGRKELGLTQAEFGSLFGVSDKAVSKWERGVNAPDISILDELSVKLNVSISELLVGEKNNNNKDITTNKATILTSKGLAIYEKILKRKYMKRILVLLFIIIVLVISFLSLYFMTNYNECFVYKISSASSEYYLEGIIASNQKDNSIMISGFKYNDPNVNTDNEFYVKEMTSYLYADDIVINKHERIVNNLSLSNAINDHYISLEEKAKIKKYFNKKNNKSKLKIMLECRNDNETITLEIPLLIEKRFSNNKLFY